MPGNCRQPTYSTGKNIIHSAIQMCTYVKPRHSTGTDTISRKVRTAQLVSSPSGQSGRSGTRCQFTR